MKHARRERLSGTAPPEDAKPRKSDWRAQHGVADAALEAAVHVDPLANRATRRLAEHEHITIAEAAQRLDVCTKTVRRYIADGRLAGYRLAGHLVRVDAAEVEALLVPMSTTRWSA